MVQLRYFKITTDTGKEYYHCQSFKPYSNDKLSQNDLLKIGINSKEVPVDEIDNIDSVEEISFDDFCAHYDVSEYF